MNIRKVVIPVAGWGTRSLPASKNIPKEMLPIFNKPVIQYVVEEAMVSGIKDVIFVTNRDKSVIEDHFDYNLQLENVLERPASWICWLKSALWPKWSTSWPCARKSSWGWGMPCCAPKAWRPMSPSPSWWATISSSATCPAYASL